MTICLYCEKNLIREMFCNKDCLKSYLYEQKCKYEDEAAQKMVPYEDEILQKKQEIENLKVEIDALKSTNIELNETIFKLKNDYRMRNICPMCKTNSIMSVHHIIPRSYGGGDNPENLIALCNICHDQVEIITDKILKENKYRFTTDDFYSMIVGNNFLDDNTSSGINKI